LEQKICASDKQHKKITASAGIAHIWSLIRREYPPKPGGAQTELVAGPGAGGV
jgi:hypothetical protein